MYKFVFYYTFLILLVIFLGKNLVDHMVMHSKFEGNGAWENNSVNKVFILQA